jgi:peptidoglycan/xylan/chitin deacetylase (PgdA/CDA1 family)
VIVTRKIALTFDIEPDYGGRLDSFNSIEKGLPIILNILKTKNVSATFFVTSDTIKEFPKTIKSLSKFHEIASHGYNHNKIQTKEDIKKTIEVFKDHGITPKGFRNPYLTPRKDLVTDLISAGYKYDSSLVKSAIPLRYNHLSIPNRPFYPQLYKIHAESKTQKKLLELPVSTIPGTVVPFGMSFLQSKLNVFYHQLIAASNKDLVFYAHGHDFVEADKKIPFYVRSNKEIAIKRLHDLVDLKNAEYITMEEMHEINK